MPVYAIGQSTIVDPEAMQEYLDRVGATIPDGVSLLASDETPEVVEGDGSALRTVIVEFPDRDVFDTWHNSDEYKPLAELRMAAAPGTFILVEGVTPDA
ncbi:MAG: DUF1330 domain-containing protein [Gaiellaceae bacterium]